MGNYLYLVNILIGLAAIILALVLYWRRNADASYRLLFELEEAFEGTLDFGRLARNILSGVIQKTWSVAGLVYWFDETLNEYKLKAIHGIPEEKIDVITEILRQPGGFVDSLGADRYLELHLGRLKAHLLPMYGEWPDLSAHYSGLLALPLCHQEKCLGALVLFRTRGDFSRRQIRLLSLLASRAAVHLENARLYHLAQETAVENARLYVNLSHLYQQATLDELTGLYNRNYFMQRLREEIKKHGRLGHELSLIFMDLDFFKRVNDLYGHQLGDQLLREFGQLLRNRTRESDLAGRFGGEEFVLFLPHTGKKTAGELAERLRVYVESQTFCADTTPLRITVSFGVNSLSPVGTPSGPDEDDFIIRKMEQLIAGADHAMYQAKNQGRNRVAVAQEETGQDADGSVVG